MYLRNLYIMFYISIDVSLKHVTKYQSKVLSKQIYIYYIVIKVVLVH